MLERDTEGAELARPAPFPGTAGRFARPVEHFKTASAGDTDGGAA
jgi:hypothetical protein